MSNNVKQARGTFFPIAEMFGYVPHANSALAQAAWTKKLCPFADGKCEKYRQYGFGYCSVRYAAEWDSGVPHTYAVCDHRLDGEPVEWAVRDYFGAREAKLVSEVTAISQPKLNIDYLAYRDDVSAQDGAEVIAIETQAIDLRGGGVGPAWRAWESGEMELWRAYFTAEARKKQRRDRVDYGINTGNVYKRLGTQVAIKGQFLKSINVPLYVVTQQRVLEQLRTRVNFEEIPHPASDWDITFVGFEYPDSASADGALPLKLGSVARTTIEQYTEAMSGRSDATHQRADLIAKVRAKSTIVKRP